MKRLLFLWCCVSVVTVFARGPFNNMPVVYAKPDSIELISHAEATGEIDQKTAMMQKLNAVFKPQHLDARYKSDTPIRCATPLVEELALTWHELSDQEKQQIQQIWPAAEIMTASPGRTASRGDTWLGTITNTYPELDKTYKTKKKGAHFIIHYTTQGSNAVSGLKYVKQIGKVFERSHKWIKKVYGKTPKNADPIHVVLITMNAWGFCSSLGYTAGDQTCDAYIAIRNSIDKATHANYKKYAKAMMRGVPPHEYFHAVQYNMDVQESTFMKESSSTWIEGMVYRMNKTYIIDGLALPYYFQHPNWPLWYTDREFHYATMAFQRFLQEHFKSIKINAELWEQCASVKGNNSMTAINTVLAAHDTDLTKTLKAFGAQNAFNRYWHYKKFKKVWPTLLVRKSHDAYGVEPTASDSSLYDTGTDYVELKAPQNIDLKKGTELLVKLKATQGSPVGYLVLERGKRNFDLMDIPTDSVDSQGYYELMTGGFGKKYKRAYLMIQVPVASHNSTPHTYTYAVAAPDVKINSFTPYPSSMQPGSISTITVSFDVQGCWNTMDYPLRYKAHIRGPGKVSDGVTDLEVNVRNGLAQTENLYFTTSYATPPGTYKFGIQFVFGTQKKRTSKTNIEWCSVVVEKPPASTPPPDGSMSQTILWTE